MNAASRTSEGYAGAWLSDRLLLLAGPGNGGTAAEPRASVGGNPISVETHEAPHESPEARVVIARFPAPANGTYAADDRVEVEVGGSRLSLSRPRAGLTAMDLSAFLRSRLAGLDAGTREDLVDFIACACAQDLEGPGRAALADRLKLIRDTLRERLPVCEIREDMPRALALDDILALDDRTFWIKGWIWDADDPSPRLEVLSPEGAREEILEGAFRWRRRDIEQLHAGLGVKRSLNGFVARVTLPTPSRRSNGWIARISVPGGEGVETAGPEVIRAPATVQDLILRDFSWADRERDRMAAEYAYPAISRVLDRVAALVEVDQTFQFGEPPEDPRASIIVPLAGETNAIEHHLIQFRSDPEVCGADLIYLVDSTDRADALASRLAELHWLYPVPFRLVTLTSEAGPAVMNSIGASIARSSRLVFLSPDVMPDVPGWLGAMDCFYDSQPNIGALGPRLIYEDGSLQHAGIGFDLISPEEAGLPVLSGDVWQARSFFKGLPQAYEGAACPRPVPAVSGACMMIDRDLFEGVGGMRNIYVESEYEDVDLCLRVAASGRENWYLPDATLFDLEGRSEIEPEDIGRQYNVLLLTHLWREQIEMAREEIETAG